MKIHWVLTFLFFFEKITNSKGLEFCQDRNKDSPTQLSYSASESSTYALNFEISSLAADLSISIYPKKGSTFGSAYISSSSSQNILKQRVDYILQDFENKYKVNITSNNTKNSFVIDLVQSINLYYTKDSNLIVSYGGNTETYSVYNKVILSFAISKASNFLIICQMPDFSGSRLVWVSIVGAIMVLIFIFCLFRICKRKNNRYSAQAQGQRYPIQNLNGHITEIQAYQIPYNYSVGRFQQVVPPNYLEATVNALTPAEIELNFKYKAPNNNNQQNFALQGTKVEIPLDQLDILSDNQRFMYNNPNLMKSQRSNNQNAIKPKQQGSNIESEMNNNNRNIPDEIWQEIQRGLGSSQGSQEAGIDSHVGHSKCLFCFDNTVNTILDPCKDLCLCKECARESINLGASCPKCKSKINGFEEF